MRRKRAQKNIIQLLRERQIGTTVPMAGSLCQRVVGLTSIAPPTLLNGHVILGFSSCGRYLLSYQNTVSDIGEHDYTLHWWTFNLYEPLSHLSQHNLFGTVFERDLHLIVCLNSDLQHTLVHGCMRAIGCEDRQTCHVMLLPGPGHCGHELSLKYELLQPFPAFQPQLALGMSDCLLFNTGDRLVAVHYGPTPTGAHCQWFSSQAHHHDSAGGEWSQGYLLPMEVFYNQTELLPASKGELCVGQTVLDVEDWAGQVFQSHLDIYHCLLDYDLRLVEVCISKRLVVFVLAALIEVYSNTGGCECALVEVVGTWDVCEGVTSVISLIQPTIIQGHAHTVSAQERAKNLHSLTIQSEHMVRALSNHTVSTGKSLQYLHHPLLPLSLVLGRIYPDLS